MCICVFLHLFTCVFVYLSKSCIEGWNGDKVEQPGGFLLSSIVSQDRLIITKSPRSGLLLVRDRDDDDVYLYLCIHLFWRPLNYDEDADVEGFEDLGLV